MKDGCLQASGSYKDIELTHPHIIAKWNSIIAKANAKEQQQNKWVKKKLRKEKLKIVFYFNSWIDWPFGTWIIKKKEKKHSRFFIIIAAVNAKDNERRMKE